MWRWFSIRLYYYDGTWAWADHGGWGTYIYPTFWSALGAALKGE